MPDVIEERSCLAPLLVWAAGLSADDASQVAIKERRNMVQLQLIARRDRGADLAEAVAKFLALATPLAALHGGERGDLMIWATGPLEYWLLADRQASSQEIAELLDLVGDIASLFDQSRGRFIIQLAGRNAIDVLAKGTSLDLHEDAFPARGACHTVIEHMPALIMRGPSSDQFDVSVPRSYAASFITWLQEAARDYSSIIETK